MCSIVRDLGGRDSECEPNLGKHNPVDAAVFCRPEQRCASRKKSRSPRSTCPLLSLRQTTSSRSRATTVSESPRGGKSRPVLAGVSFRTIGHPCAAAPAELPCGADSQGDGIGLAHKPCDEFGCREAAVRQRFVAEDGSFSTFSLAVAVSATDFFVGTADADGNPSTWQVCTRRRSGSPRPQGCQPAEYHSRSTYNKVHLHRHRLTVVNPD